MRIVIEVTAGPDQGQTYVFDRHDTFLVGRSRRAHFRLPSDDRYFSRLHFMIEVNPPHCRLIDMGSRNGTYVNGQRVQATDLHHGDLIQGGQTVLRVAIEGDDGEFVSAPSTSDAPTLRPEAEVVPALDTPISLPSGSCRICGSALTRTVGIVAGRWPICGDCRDAGRQQAQTVPGYFRVRLLRPGGRTFLALKEADGNPVALKLLSLPEGIDRAQVNSFMKQAESYAALKHPYIAAWQEGGLAAGQVYFVTELVRGKTLAHLVQERGPLPIGEAVELISQVLEALEFAHARELVHRDLKPANIMVNDEGMIRLLDFGLAGLYRVSPLSGFSLQGEFAAAVPFLAPEQLSRFREARPESDQYSAAAILYFLLTAAHPHDFPPEFHERVLLLLQAEPVPLRQRRAEVPEKLANAIHRALRNEPEQRFANVTEFLQSLA